MFLINPIAYILALIVAVLTSALLRRRRPESVVRRIGVSWVVLLVIGIPALLAAEGVASLVHSLSPLDVSRDVLMRISNGTTVFVVPLFSLLATEWWVRQTVTEGSARQSHQSRHDPIAKPIQSRRRIVVTGNSGSGKSTLAKRLAASLDRPHFDLDEVAFADQQGTRRPAAESLAALQSAGLGDDTKAVIEGCYADLAEALIGPKDHLIWLDLPVAACVENAKARPYEPHKWPSAEQQNAFLPALLTYIEGYPDRDDPTGRPAHAELFAAAPCSKQTFDRRPIAPRRRRRF